MRWCSAPFASTAKETGEGVRLPHIMAIAEHHFFAGGCLQNSEIIGRAAAGEMLAVTAQAPSGTWVEVREVRFADTTDPVDFLAVDFLLRDLSTNTQTSSRSQFLKLYGCTPDELGDLSADQLPLYSGGLALMFLTAYAGKKLRSFIEAFR